MKPSIGDIIEATYDQDVLLKGEKYEVISHGKYGDYSHSWIYVRTDTQGEYVGSCSDREIKQPYSYLAPDEYTVIIHDGKEVVYD